MEINKIGVSYSQVKATKHYNQHHLMKYDVVNPWQVIIIKHAPHQRQPQLIHFERVNAHRSQWLLLVLVLFGWTKISISVNGDESEIHNGYVAIRRVETFINTGEVGCDDVSPIHQLKWARMHIMWWHCFFKLGWSVGPLSAVCLQCDLRLIIRRRLKWGITDS